MGQWIARGLFIGVFALTGCKTAKMTAVKKSPRNAARNNLNNTGTPTFGPSNPNSTGDNSATNSGPGGGSSGRSSTSSPIGSGEPAASGPDITSDGSFTRIADAEVRPGSLAGVDLGCGEGGTPCPKPPPERVMCERTPIGAKLVNPELNMIFVVDTSSSLNGGAYKSKSGKDGGELKAIAQEIGEFIKQLDLNTNLRIGMILAHGPTRAATKGSKAHSGRWFGTLYHKDNAADPTKVIAVTDILEQKRKTNPKASEEELRKQVLSEIGKRLEARMDKMPIESKGAEGEAMLLSAREAFINPEKRSDLERAGLVKKDTPLAVVFVTDEQDVCYEYKAGEERRDTDIERAYQTGPHCQKAVKSVYEGDKLVSVTPRPLKPEDVYDAMSAVVGSNKLIVMSIAYNDNRVPVGDQDENEMGHGILELVNKAGGQKANLSEITLGNATFKDALTQLGQFTALKMEFDPVFACASTIHPDNVNKSTVEVRIYDPNQRQIALFKGSCDPKKAKSCEGVDGHAAWEVRRNAAGSGGSPLYGTARVTSDKLRKLLNSNHDFVNGTVVISFIPLVRPEDQE